MGTVLVERGRRVGTRLVEEAKEGSCVQKLVGCLCLKFSTLEETASDVSCSHTRFGQELRGDEQVCGWRRDFYRVHPRHVQEL